MGVYEAVKERIMELCERKKITINKLAMDSGVARSSVKNILYGKSKNPGIVTLKMLCDGLNVSLVEFFDCPLFAELEQELC